MFNEEGILNKVVTAAIVGLLGWLVITTQNMSVQQAVLSSEVQSIKQTIIQAQSQGYTRIEATQLQESVERLRERVKRLEDER